VQVSGSNRSTRDSLGRVQGEQLNNPRWLKDESLDVPCVDVESTPSKQDSIWSSTIGISIDSTYGVL
jgi:hypothetical protein